MSPATGRAQGWKKTFHNLQHPFSVRQTPDGGAVFVATMQFGWPNRDMVIVKTDADGKVQWEKTTGGTGDDEGRFLAMTSDNCIVATGRKTYSANNSDVYLVKLALSGDIIWERIFNFGADDPKCVLPTPDGGYLVALETNNQLRLLKTDGEGLELWSMAYPQTLWRRVNHLEITSDGGMLVTLLENNLPLVVPIAYILKLDAGGGIQFERAFQHFSSYGTTDVAKARPLGSDQYILAHRDSVYWLDLSGNLKQAMRIVSPHHFYLTDILPADDGGFWAYATEYSFTTPSFSNLWLGRFSPDNTLLWERKTRMPAFSHTTLTSERLADGGFFLTGHFLQNNQYRTYLLRTDSSGQMFTNQVKGAVFWDKNQDCTLSSAEPALPGWVVKIEHPNGETYYASTDSTGQYAAEIGEGEHIVSVFPPNSLWNAGCFQDVPIQFDSAFGQTNVDFPIKNTADCPLTWVDAGTGNWVPCTENTLAVSYANQGTAPAPAATVRLTFDTLMMVTEVSLPYTQTGVREFLIPLGDLAPLQSGSFTVQVVPSCDGLVTGQTKCVTAQIEPEAPCLSSPDGPLFVVAGSCHADSVRFHVQNKGTGAPGMLEFIIIEDNIMYTQPDALQMSAGGQATYSFPANGATWRFEGTQASDVADWKSDTRIAAAVEGCAASGAFSTGYVNQYSLFDGGNFTETECREVVATAGGTEKIAYPSGYTNEHFISANTDIEYALHFQNTTADTVRFAVLRDTIDVAHLEVASALPGPASHPYWLTISDIGVLTFRFDSIMLPPGAGGWVKFRISQQPGLPNGTVIHNRASVGFDYDAPVLTNETFHTITDPGGVGTNETVKRLSPTSPSIWPIPTSAAVFLEMPQAGRYRVSVCDLNGRRLLDKNFYGKRLTITDGELPAGVFIVTVWAGNRLAGTARIVKIQ